MQKARSHAVHAVALIAGGLTCWAVRSGWPMMWATLAIMMYDNIYGMLEMQMLWQCHKDTGLPVHVIKARMRSDRLFG